MAIDDNAEGEVAVPGPEERLPTSVLFVCGQNAIRSAMAEWALKHYLGRRIFVDSAGVKCGETDPFAVSVMAELGIDMARHRSKGLDDLEDESFDVVITLTPEAHHRALEMTRTTGCDVEYWPTYDPTIIEGNREMMLDAFRKTRDSILGRLRKRFRLPQA